MNGLYIGCLVGCLFQFILDSSNLIFDARDRPLVLISWKFAQFPQLSTVALKKCSQCHNTILASSLFAVQSHLSKDILMLFLCSCSHILLMLECSDQAYKTEPGKQWGKVLDVDAIQAISFCGNPHKKREDTASDKCERWGKFHTAPSYYATGGIEA